MSARLFECYPFENFFEEDVARYLASKMNSNYRLVHNIMRPNRNRNVFLPKEIDLCILSKSGYINMVEIKGFKNPPSIDDRWINNRQRNPVEDMKRYGQLLRTDLKKKNSLSFLTEPYLILRNKDSSKISDKWKDNCGTMYEYLQGFLSRPSLPKKLVYDSRELDMVREKFLCDAKIDPFVGFEKEDFNKLREYEIYYDSFDDKAFYENILSTFYYKLRCLDYEIRSKFRQKGISFYQHVSTAKPTAPSPIQYLAFTLIDTESFHTEPQITFHVSSKDWYKPDQPDGDHFSVKLAFFHSSEWLRKLLMKFRSDKVGFFKKIQNTFGRKHYYFISSLTPHDNLISKPVKDLEFGDIEELAHRSLDRRAYIRGIGFEKPMFYASHKKLGNRKKLVQFLNNEMSFLQECLRDILPEYFIEKKLN